MIERLLKLLAKYDATDAVMWNENLEFSINCSDFFYWGCADFEPISTLQNIEILETCFQSNADHGYLLYCCKQRKMRPQGAYYKYLPIETWELFDACGPVRLADVGNPETRPEV